MNDYQSSAARAVDLATQEIETSKDLYGILTGYNAFRRRVAVAALRAAADQVVPIPQENSSHDCCAGIIKSVRDRILDIAAELDGGRQ